MKNNNSKVSALLALFTVVIMFTACRKNDPVAPPASAIAPKALTSARVSVLGKAVGATQISGVGFYAEASECDAASQGATYAVRMTGDIEGCLYVFVDEYDCSPSGTYREKGREHFVGTYNGETGSFWTGYKFESKYQGCAANGAALGSEIFGRCQHPIVEGSGEGVFEGVTGRLDFQDDIAAGNFPYRGHLGF